ncbi:cation:proton antiporter [Streptomyces sp. WG-D5]
MAVETTLVAVLGVVSIVATAVFSGRLGLAAPLALVVVGLGLSFVPGVPHPEIDPEWILAGVLPPLLYSGAVNMPITDFRRNLKPITGLAVVLVALSTLGCGWLFHWLVPDIGWPAAFALGAVVSPTDAVAATSVGRRLGLPHRLLTLLEGEGLVNDASSLVLLRSAVAAMAGAVSVWGVIGDFVWAVVCATAVGLVVGIVNVRVRGLLRDSVLNTAVSFIVPFIAYVPAEEWNASGVLSVVVAGLVTGHLSPRYLRAQDRLAEAVNWRTLAFLLESSIFLLMGLSVKALVDEVRTDHLDMGRALWIGLAASALVILIRIAFTGPLVAMLHRESRRAERSKPVLDRIQERLNNPDAVPDHHPTTEPPRHRPRRRRPRVDTPEQLARFQRRVTKVRADVEFHTTQKLGWRGSVVLAWAGMRGAITLAAAQTLPEDTPARPLLILIAFVVATVTLLLQGLTLPPVIRAVHVPPDDTARRRDEYVSLLKAFNATALDLLDDEDLRRPDGSAYDPDVLDQLRRDLRLRDPSEMPEPAPTPDLDPRVQYVELKLRVLDAETRRLARERSRGTCSSVVLGQAQRALDTEAARLEQLSDRNVD